MIPTPRPGPRPGDCHDCGRQHTGECHLAEAERNREAPEDEQAKRIGASDRFESTIAAWLLRWAPVREMTTEPVPLEPIEITSGGYGYRQGGKDYALPYPTWRRWGEA